MTMKSLLKMYVETYETSSKSFYAMFITVVCYDGQRKRVFTINRKTEKFANLKISSNLLKNFLLKSVAKISVAY